MKITREMIEENIVFHCDTEDKANELLGKLDSLGYKWGNGKSYLYDNYYNRYKENTCYNPYKGTYNDTSFSKIDNYDIIEYSLDNKEFKMDDIKDGYLIELRNGDKHLCCNGFKDGKIFVGYDGVGYGGLLYADDYRLDLMYKNLGNGYLSDFDIVKVYDKSYKYDDLLSYEMDNRNFKCVRVLSFETSLRNLLWKREETTEMTIEELCKIAGRDIKIVK